MADRAHKLTDEELAALERRVKGAYRKAYKDLRDKVGAYFESFAKRDAEMQALLTKGEITEEKYRLWRLAQIGRGRRFEALRDEVARRMTQANTMAMTYVNDATPGVYALNHNYAAYTIEETTGDVGFTLYDEQTVRRLVKEQPHLLPEPRVDIPRDQRWNRKKMTAEVTSGILQGESVGKLAARLQNITDMNRMAALRNARTAVTGAQNAGRQDTYEAAVDAGIELEKEWIATLDNKTRHSHRILDGEVVDYDATFSNGCRYPGDPDGLPKEVYNCRCTMAARVKGVREAEPTMRRVRDPLSGRNVVVPDMTYDQWEKWKQELQQRAGVGIIKAKIERGEISTKISRQQQNKHVRGTAQFEQYKASRLTQGRTPQSVLTIPEAEAQDLILSFAGSGEIDATGSGTYRNVEFFNANKTVGQYFENGGYKDTTRFAVHYGKKGAHLVPVPPRKEK